MSKFSSIFSARNLSLAEISCYSLFIVSLVFGIRPLNSIMIALLTIIALILSFRCSRVNFSSREVLLFVSGCFIFYSLHIVSLFYSSNPVEVYRHLQLKSSLVFVPLIFLINPPNATLVRKMSGMLIIAILMATSTCLILAFYRYVTFADSSAFFYHALVSPFKHHAVLFSILVSFASVILMIRITDKLYYFNITSDIAVLCLFFGFLLLLSSKLIITLYLVFTLAYFLTRIKTRKLTVSVLFIFVVSVTSVLTTSNPISQRFSEIVNSDLELISQENFSQGTYFNGLQFRLLQWKNVWELLQTNDAFLVGLSPGDAQMQLDELYRRKDMYVGLPERGERGFLGYNAHNQYLESLLQFGILGIIAFLIAISGLIRIGVCSSSLLPRFMILVIISFCFTESVLESQFGLVVFTFFPLFFFTNIKHLDRGEDKLPNSH